MGAFFFRKPDVWKMYEKRDIRGLMKALKYKDPEVRKEAVERLRSLAEFEDSYHELFISPLEIINYDLVRALIPMLDDEDKTVREEAKSLYIYGERLFERLGEADQVAVPDYLVRVAQETSPNDSIRVRDLRLECAVRAEMAYEKVRRGFCSVCGVKWPRSTVETLFSPYRLLGGIVTPGTTEPAGRCPTCRNYYCAKCAKITPPVVLCPKCGDNLTYHIEEDVDDIRSRFEYGRSVSIRGINTIYSFKLEMNRDVEGLIKALKHRDDDIRADAAKALGEIRDPRAVEPLIDALKPDPDSFVRQRAAYALGNIGDAKAVEPLIQSLKDEDKDVRWAAASSLGDLGDIRAVKPLIQALKDEDKDVQKTAEWALKKIKAKKAGKASNSA